MDNLSIAVTADTSSLRAQMALAQADVRAYGSIVRQTANDLRTAGDAAKAGLMASLERQSALLGEATAAARRYGQEIKAAMRPEGGGGIAAAFSGAAEEIEGLTGGLGAIKGAMMEIAEAVGVAFGVERIGDWMVETAEAGEKAVNTAAAVGMSTQKFLEFSGAMQLSGGDADSASRTLERLARNVGDALNNPASRSAASFKALGISMGELRATGGDVDKVLQLIIGAANEFAPSMSRTAILMSLTGRGMNELAGLLRGGTEAYKENKAAAVALGAANASYAAGQAESGEAVRTLRLANKGLSDELFHDLKPAFDEALNGLTVFVNNTRLAAKAADEFLAPLGGISGALKTIGGMVTALPIPFVGPLGAMLDNLPTKSAVTAETTLPPVDVTAKRVAPWPDKAGAGNSAYEAFAANERLKIAEAQGDQAKIEAIYAEWLAHAAAIYGQDSKQYREVALAKVNFEKEAQAKHFAILEEGVSADISAAGRSLNAFKAAMAEMAATGKITPQQAAGFDIQFEAGSYDRVSAELQKLYGEAGLTAGEIARVNKLVEELNSQHLQNEAGLNKDWTAAGEKAAETFAAPWRSSIDKLGTELQTALTDALTGKRGSVAQAMQQLRTGLVSSTIGLFGGAASKVAGGPLARLLDTRSTDKEGNALGVGDVLGNKLGELMSQGLKSLLPSMSSLFGTGTQTAAQATELSAVTAAMTEMVATTTGAMTEMAASVTTAMTEMMSVTTVKAAIPFAAGGYDVPSYAGGGWSIPGGLSMLHPREMVLPAHLAEGVRQMVAGGGTAGGGGGIHVHNQNNFGAFSDAASIDRGYKVMERRIVSSMRRLIPT